MSAPFTFFRISALSHDFTSRVRREMKDDFGHALSVRCDSSRHQCRACLHLTEPEEGFILLSYAPFTSDQPYAEVGPIFIHERECRPYGETQKYPAEFPREAVVLRAYNAGNEIEDAAFVGKRPVEEAIARLFENPRVSYLHARNSTYGCFMFRIDRSSGLEAPMAASPPEPVIEARYVAAVGDDDPVRVMAQTPDRVRRLIRGLTERQLETKPAP